MTVRGGRPAGESLLHGAVSPQGQVFTVRYAASRRLHASGEVHPADELSPYRASAWYHPGGCCSIVAPASVNGRSPICSGYDYITVR